MIEDGIRTLLLADATVLSSVGARGVYPLFADDDVTLPFIVYRRIQTESTDDMDGPSGLAGCTLQFDCWAESYSEARSLSRAVQDTLQAYKGTVGTDVIQGIFFVDMRDIAVPPTAKPEIGLYGSQVEFLVWCEE